MSNYKIATKCVQSGWIPKNSEPRVLPIYQSTTFKYSSTEEMADLFDLKASGYFYSRVQNPTTDCVAAKICDLEGGVAAMLTSSGQAATFYSILNICESGDHVISMSTIYGGTFNLFNVTLRKMNIECTFIDQDASEEEISSAFRENTKAVFAETLANPALRVLDIEKLARIAHKHGCPLIVDNTFPTPMNCRPFEWGADIVVHATTKYMDGHASTIGGCIVDSGNFDWSKYPEKYRTLNEPDESYHGLVFVDAFKEAAYITKALVQLMRDMGSTQSAMNAFLVNIGLETLHLRMERHCSNALKIAEFLKDHPMIEAIHYPDLESDPYHELAKKYMPNGTSGVISFDLKGGREAGINFINSLKLIAIVTHVADARSSVLHPAAHTHRQLTEEQLIAAGVGPGTIRLSVGIEDVDDLLEDIRTALEQI